MLVRMALIDEARSALQRGDRHTAQQMLTSIVKREPTNGEAWYKLAETLDDWQQQTYCYGMATRLGYSPQQIVLQTAPSGPTWPVAPQPPTVVVIREVQARETDTNHSQAVPIIIVTLIILIGAVAAWAVLNGVQLPLGR